MAKRKNGGFINRLIMGKEKSEEFARASLPTNRWQLFWDIFKSCFWKLVLVNILVILFALPLILFIVFKKVSATNFGMVYPFSQGFGVGYLAPSSIAGYREQAILSINVIYNLLFPAVGVFMAIGISGAMYVLRNMVWTEGVFVANDFWKGIKQNFLQICVICIIYSMILYLCFASFSVLDVALATNEIKEWLTILIKCLIIVGMVLVSFIALHMITFSVNYKLRFRDLIKNGFLFTICLIPHNIFMGIGCSLPLVIGILLITKVGGLLAVVGALILLFFGFSIPFLIWTDYTQWGFDTFINSKIKNVKVGRGLHEKVGDASNDTAQKYKQQHGLLPQSSFGLRPIKPITDDELQIEELKEGFSRKDIERLNESKQRIYEDHAKYVEEHKNDEKYRIAIQNENKEDLERQKRIELAKKELKKRKQNK